MERDHYIPPPPPPDASQDAKLSYVVDRVWRMELRQVEDHGDLQRLKQDVEGDGSRPSLRERMTRMEVWLAAWMLAVTLAAPIVSALFLKWWSS